MHPRGRSFADLKDWSAEIAHALKVQPTRAEDLDLLVDCAAQRVVPRDPRGAFYEIE